jgi:acetyl esterase
MAFFTRHAVSAQTPTDDWRVSPLWAENLQDVAPALVITAGADILMDEGVLYAQWLQEAGVAVEHVHYPGVVHGFMGMAGQLAVAREAMDKIAATLHARLGC